MKTILTIIAAIAMTGCATTGGMGSQYVPVVDLRGGDTASYQRDLQECQALAQQRNQAQQQAIAGALAGAFLGALIAPRGYRNELAGRGALMGGVAGAGTGIETQQSIIKRCLSGRGYSVLD